jgi:hypothetical protein
MQTLENQIQFRFKIYTNIVCLNDGNLYQLQHCPNIRTKVFRKLKYNEKRKAFYIDRQLVTLEKFKKLKIKHKLTIN